MCIRDRLVAIDTVREGRPYYSPRVEAELARAPETGPMERAPGSARLTSRENEVLRMIARGLSTKEIAAQLVISARTVETHRANLMRKLEIKSIARLTQYAVSY